MGSKKNKIQKGEITMKKKVFVKPVGVVLDDELFEQLVEFTEREEVSKSEFIRSLIENYFRDRSKTEGKTEIETKGGKHHG
jgi:metal-responsive CopG/Arc/MetJ family transcriptional regulator